MSAGQLGAGCPYCIHIPRGIHNKEGVIQRANESELNLLRCPLKRDYRRRHGRARHKQDNKIHLIHHSTTFVSPSGRNY